MLTDTIEGKRSSAEMLKRWYWYNQIGNESLWERICWNQKGSLTKEGQNESAKLNLDNINTALLLHVILTQMSTSPEIKKHEENT